MAALLLIATPRPGLVVQSGGLYTRLDGYGPLGSTSGAGRPSDVRRRRRPPSVGNAWTGPRAVHTYHPGPIRGPSYHPTTRAGKSRAVGPRSSPAGRDRSPAVQVETTTRAKAGRHPVAGRGGGGGDRRPWACPRRGDSDHHRPGPGRRATAGQRAGNQANPSGPRSGRQSGLTRGSLLPRLKEGGSPAD